MMRRLLVATALCGLVLVPLRAEAYCRSRTCDPRKQQCEMEGLCVVEGLELFRRSSCVTFSVQQDGSAKHGISAEALEEVVSGAFERWLSADCGGGRHPSLRVENIGSVSCAATQYNCDGEGNANVILFQDESWPHSDAASTFALTTVYYLPRTGEIFDADIEINGLIPAILIGEPRDGVDLPSILTHEIGHFLGLAHSEVPSAVMWMNYTPGEDNLRNLRNDDAEGICSVYPPDRETATNSCTPAFGFTSECGADQHDACAIEQASSDSGCCSTAPGRPDARGTLAFGALALAFGAARWRRRRR